MERQEGYYWVKQRHKTKHEIAEFIHSTYHSEGGFWILRGFWILMGDEGDYQDDYFEHINEVRIKQPGELPD